MSSLEGAVRAVEKGLLTINYLPGTRPVALNLLDRMAFYKVPGFSIALIHQGELAWMNGYGVQEAGSSRMVGIETIFQAASISKPVTAVIALKLVQDGLLELDRDVNEMLHSWQVPENEHTAEQKVTLRGLLSHTAGLSVPGYPGYPVGSELPNTIQILNGELPAESAPVEVVQPPGTGFRYSGGGYVLVQALIEDAAGCSLADLAQEIIFAKLGMVNSTFEPVLPARYHPHTATAHRINGEAVPGKWHIYPEQAPASLWSTPSDLSRLVVEIIKSHQGESDRMLSPEMTRLMLSSHLDWMGLGLVTVEKDGWKWFEHAGWNEGFHSNLIGCQDAGQGVVWMANGENGKLLGQEVVRGLARVFGWPGHQPVQKSVVMVNPKELCRYAGQYRHADYPDFGIEVVLASDTLHLQETPAGVRCQLYPEAENVFFCLPRPEKYSFICNRRGEVGGMMIGKYERLDKIG